MALNDYLNETRAELQHVSWPSRSQAVQFTLAVILLSAVTSVVIFGFDQAFVALLTKFVLK